MMIGLEIATLVLVSLPWAMALVNECTCGAIEQGFDRRYTRIQEMNRRLERIEEHLSTA